LVYAYTIKPLYSKNIENKSVMSLSSSIINIFALDFDV
jgi:hypothetical protein